MKDKKNVFAAISDAARSVQDDEPQSEQRFPLRKRAGSDRTLITDKPLSI
ncbi:hypothetical protein [Nostoc sp. 'Peltigera malacea cyanobiont' DB3992]|nr:hypothetical protein [Nostoc sp. 'Peltigera malacea cyanobiont' DB3992]